MERLYNSIGYYLANDPNFDNIWSQFDSDFDVASVALSQFFDDLPQRVVTGFAVSSISSFVMIGAPVTSQMGPSTSFISSLNSAGGIATEANRIPTRVSVVSSIPPDDVLFRALTANSTAFNLLTSARSVTSYVALALWTHYENHPDPLLAMYADRWGDLYFELEHLDVEWHRLIGSLIDYPTRAVEYQDGIVPLTKMVWPGHTRLHERLTPSFNIRHGDQIDHPEMVELYKLVLESDFQVNLRPPPPPVTVSISGPVNHCISSPPPVYEAVASGPGVFSHTWWINGVSQYVNSSTLEWAGRTAGHHTIVVDAYYPGGVASDTMISHIHDYCE